jgi:O-antigen/teichoic acid export membrane protein
VSRRPNNLLRTVLANCSARVLAILGLTVATIIVARVGGPSAVGAYALLRMLPGLVGVLCVAGLPGALPYFLAEPRRSTAALWPTLVTIAATGAILGSLVWLLASPLLKDTFFPNDSTAVIAVAGVTVATQLMLTVGKTALQGLQDRRGADAVIAAEELAFLPLYVAPLMLGVHGTPAIIVGLAAADLVVAFGAWRRVSRQLGWRRLGVTAGHGWRGRPNRPLLAEVVTYGMRGQVGGAINLLNLRLDFAILGAMAGPAVLGTYAVASKYAELLRLPGTALTWVSYPRVSANSAAEAAAWARRLVAPTALGIMLAAVPLALLTAPVMRLLYGSRLDPAIGPAQVLLVGMLLGGAAGVASGYLYGIGRPGLNSLAMGLGLVVTVILDLALIPRFGAMGASVASATAYLLTDALLIGLLLRISRRAYTTDFVPPRATSVEVSP